MVKVGRPDILLVFVVGALQLLVIASGSAVWIWWWNWSSRNSLRWSPALWMALVVELIPFLIVGAMADDIGTSQLEHLELWCLILDRCLTGGDGESVHLWCFLSSGITVIEDDHIDRCSRFPEERGSLHLSIKNADLLL